MRYQSPDHDVVINAQGGYAALERLGFKPETQTKESEMAKKKKAAVKESVKQSVKENAKDPQADAKPEAVDSGSQSRDQLMTIVRNRAISNFRVMNKAELREIVDGASKERIVEIQKQAVERWKSGWGTKGKK